MKEKTKKPKKAAGFPLLRPLLILLIIGFFFFVIGQNIFIWVKDSTYFRIKRVTCTMSTKARSLDKFLYLQGKSIFDVDLAGLQRQLEWSFPEVAQVRAIKRFPDEIRIVLKERSPCAVIALGGNYFVIDRQGYVISKGDSLARTLPIIQGLGSPSRSIGLGQLVASENLKIALKALDIFSKTKTLRSFSIMKIDVENLSKVTFYLSDQLQVIVDKENMEKRIDTLGIILSTAKLDWERIRHIDLRFQDPVIKYEE